MKIYKLAMFMIDILTKIFSEYIFIAIALILGLIITIEDFKIDKIRNKWIRLGMIIGFLAYLVSISFLFLSNQNIIWQNYWLIILNTLIAFVLGFILWYFKLWSGGDAKLFTLFVFLIPISYYQNWHWKYWLGLTLFINITFPIFIYLIIKFLLYPFQLAINYIKKPALLKKYFNDHKVQKKIEKKKLTEYLAAGLSFIAILIIFQILRIRLSEFLNPYLGNLMIIFYFFMGFIVFAPLRNILKKYLFLAIFFAVAYFIFGYFYFRPLVYADLHRIFALQFLIMISYYYIFKYGKTVLTFLYNSAEVKMIPLADLSAGVYINKDYIKKIFNTTSDLEKFKDSLSATLEKEEKDKLWNLLKRKIASDKGRKQYKLLSVFRYLRLEKLPYLFIELYQQKKQKKEDDKFLDIITKKLTKEQQLELNHILAKTHYIQKFLKTIKGKLTDEQAQKIKEMINEHNKKIEASGLPPVDKIILHKTFSFAPFMLLGVLITLVTKSSLIHLICQYLLHR